MLIEINMPAAREIAHAARRVKRDADLLHLDREVTIPLFAQSAEASRQVIRIADAIVQEGIDGAADADVLEAVLAGADIT